MKQSMSAGGYYENANSPTSPSQPVASNLSHILAGGPSSNTFRRQSTKDGGKPRQPQLLHKRMQDMAISQAQANDLILSTNLEEMAINTNIPQWLIYSWTSKAKDKKITDKRTQQCVAEVFIFIMVHAYSSVDGVETICVSCRIVSESKRFTSGDRGKKSVNNISECSSDSRQEYL